MPLRQVGLYLLLAAILLGFGGPACAQKAVSSPAPQVTVKVFDQVRSPVAKAVVDWTIATLDRTQPFTNEATGKRDDIVSSKPNGKVFNRTAKGEHPWIAVAYGMQELDQAYSIRMVMAHQ